MATTIVTKRGDTKITFKDVPTIDGVPIPPANLAGCTLSFLLRIADDSLPGIKQTAVINVDGSFSYDPTAGDVGTVGTFRQEWELLYPTGKILTFPNSGWNKIKILEDLG